MAKTMRILLLAALLQCGVMSALQKVRGEAELFEVMGKGKSVVVKVVMQGCGACTMIKDYVEELQKENPEVIFVEAELHENPDLVQKHGITAAPTILFYHTGASKPHDKIVGANKEAIKNKVQELKAKAAPAKVETKKEVAKPAKQKKHASMTGIKRIENKEALTNALNNNKHVVLKFTTSHCPACKDIKPAYDKLANKYTDIVFAEADVDNNRDFATEYAIASVPTFLFFESGSSKPTRIVGATETELEAKIKSLTGPKAATPKKAKPVAKAEPKTKKAAPAKAEPKAKAEKKAMPKKQAKKSAKKPMPKKEQKAKRSSKKHVEEQITGKGCTTASCGSCEKNCNSCGC